MTTTAAKRRAEQQVTDVTFATIEAKQARTDARLDALTRDIENITHGIHELTNIVRASNKTPWNNIIAAVAVAFSIMAAGVSIVLQSQSDTVARIERSQNDRITALDSAMSRADLQLDTILQREMRLLDDNTKAHMKEVDARLSQRLNQTMERLRTVELWQRENNVSNTAEIARLQEAVEDLKEQMKLADRLSKDRDVLQGHRIDRLEDTVILPSRKP